MTIEARERLLAMPGDPLVEAEWHRVLFLNYRISPAILRPRVPPAFELEQHEGSACLSVVAVTMRRFRRAPGAPLWGLAFRALAEQRFLNLRAYVRRGDEPGAFFLWGWLSRPWRLPVPSRLGGLHFEFAALDFAHAHETGVLRGRATAGRWAFSWCATLDASARFVPCESGSIGALALECYSGFYERSGADYVFRAWHDPWRAAPVAARVEDDGLVRARFPWFAEAKLAEALYAPLCEVVWLGRAHRIAAARGALSERN